MGPNSCEGDSPDQQEGGFKSTIIGSDDFLDMDEDVSIRPITSMTI